MYKAFVFACAIFATFAAAETQAEKDENFFQGMEQGFFLRNDPQGYKQFDCPALVLDQATQAKFTQIMAPA